MDDSFACERRRTRHLRSVHCIIRSRCWAACDDVTAELAKAVWDDVMTAVADCRDVVADCEELGQVLIVAVEDAQMALKDDSYFDADCKFVVVAF